MRGFSRLRPHYAGPLISIQYAVDLAIDTGSDVLPSSDAKAPHGVGQLAFSPNMTGTFTYHCEYYPLNERNYTNIQITINFFYYALESPTNPNNSTRLTDYG